MQNKQLFRMMTLAAMFAGGSIERDRREYIENPDKKQDYILVPKRNPIPKGHSEFWFDKNGQQTRLKAETVFYCTALNLKNAQRKFKKFISNNGNTGNSK
jgi:hypothetical protein